MSQREGERERKREVRMHTFTCMCALGAMSAYRAVRGVF